MSDTVISVEGLSKRYLLGENERAQSFREAVSSMATAPWRRIRRMVDGGGTQEFWALKDVNFEVKRGEVVGVIGRNGAGKSTLLKVLSRITPPTSGRIRLKGRVASLLEVGTGFHPELTGRENIYMNGTMLGMTRGEIRRKFDEIVAFSEIEKFLDTPVKRYSSGMYVRLAFAVAAHLEPEILIVDEVLAVGDAQFQKKCLGKMKEVSQGGGRTVLFVSHNMAAVSALCSQAVVMDKGRAGFAGGVRPAVAAYQRQAVPPDDQIINRIRQSAEVSITRVEINGSPLAVQEVPPGEQRLTLHLEGTLSGRTRFAPELSLVDRNDTVLAMCAPAHETGECPSHAEGYFSFTLSIAVPPHVSAGSYSINLDLAETNVRYVARYSRIADLDFSGTSTASGKALRYDSGEGFIQMLAIEYRH